MAKAHAETDTESTSAGPSLTRAQPASANEVILGRARLAPGAGVLGISPAQLLALQRAAGNQATAEFLTDFQRGAPSGGATATVESAPAAAAPPPVIQRPKAPARPSPAQLQRPALAPPKRAVREPTSGGLPAGEGLEALVSNVDQSALPTAAPPARLAGAGAPPPGGYGVAASMKSFLTTIGGGDPLTGSRLLLELTRPVPVWGMLTGMASDSIAMYQDLDSVPPDAPFATTAIAFRDATALFNNLLGAVAALDQQIQDAATATVVGAVIDPVTAEIQVGLKTAKLYADGVQIFLDVVIASDAAYQASKSPRGSAQLDKWNGIFQNFEASLITDSVGTVIDYIDLATAGFANAENVKGIARWAFVALKTIRPMGRTIAQVLNNVVSLYLGKGLPKFSGTAPAPGPAPKPIPVPGPAPKAPVQRIPTSASAASVAEVLVIDALIGELGEARALWQLGDEVIGTTEAQFRQLEAQMRALATQANDGRDPFIIIRDQARLSLDRAAYSITELTQMGQEAGKVFTESQSIIAGTDRAIAGFERIRIPQVHVPAPKDGGILGTLERGGAAAADALLQGVLSPLRGQVDRLRKQAERPLEVVKAHATDVADFTRIFEGECVKAVEVLTKHVTVLSEKLGHVQNFEQLVDLLMRQLTEAMGITGGAGLDDVRTAWADVGTTLAEAEAWAQDVRRLILIRKQAEEEAQAPTVDATMAMPPPDEEEPL